MIVSGVVDPDGPTEEAECQLKLSHRNMCLLSKSFCDAGFVSVLEWVIRDRIDLNNLIGELERYHPNLVVLELPREVRRQRKLHNHDRWAYSEIEFIRDFKNVGLQVDTGSLSPEECVRYILAHKSEARYPRL